MGCSVFSGGPGSLKLPSVYSLNTVHQARRCLWSGAPASAVSGGPRGVTEPRRCRFAAWSPAPSPASAAAAAATAAAEPSLEPSCAQCSRGLACGAAACKVFSALCVSPHPNCSNTYHVTAGAPAHRRFMLCNAPRERVRGGAGRGGEASTCRWRKGPPDAGGGKWLRATAPLHAALATPQLSGRLRYTPWQSLSGS